MYSVKFSYHSHFANTLNPEDIGSHPKPDGWIIDGEIHEDWYQWVNEFTATKGKWKVWGDFEKEVFATNEKAYNDFLKYHAPHEWDYWDI